MRSVCATFATGGDDDVDHDDRIMRAFERFATVPIVSMESAREHPCQGLADLLTIEEQFGSAKGLPVALTWAPHIKPLPKAVPNSFLLTAAARGCEIRVAHPPGFELHPDMIREAQAIRSRVRAAALPSRQIRLSRFKGRALFMRKRGDRRRAAGLAPQSVRAHGEWMISPEHMEQAAADAIFLHCLPVRRNVEVADAVLDGKWSRVIDEAENRFHVQRALLDWLLN